MNIVARIRAFVVREVVLVVAILAALVSCVFVTPDVQYASYIDWRTLGLLFCLMVVVTGLRFLGVMRLFGEWVVSKARSKKVLAALLVGLTFGTSMVITNDVALITFVPFALVVMHAAEMKTEGAAVVVLMTIAANLGSMLFPMGNPQNLFLFQASGLSFLEFVCLMLPYTVLSACLLIGALLLLFRKTTEAKKTGIGSMKTPMLSRVEWLKTAVYGFLFALCIGAVLDLVPLLWCLAIVLVIVLVMDASVLRRIDYGLLLTFVALFVFVGNMGRLSVVHDVVSWLVGLSPVLVAILSSQVISNVPAAVLLSGFTDQWQALIVGTNIGGLGSLIASMASVISFKIATVGGLVSRKVYLRVFAQYNIAFLLVLLAAYVAINWLCGSG